MSDDKTQSGDGSESKESLIEFPTELSIKAMGVSNEGFASLVAELVRAHLDPEESMEVTTIPSSKGKYVSVRVRFVARNQPHLEAIYADLHQHELVLLTL